MSDYLARFQSSTWRKVNPEDYHAFCIEERKKEENARLEGIARARWGDDEQALQFETTLIEELGSTDGTLAFANWCHSVGKYRQCAIGEISCRVDRLLSGLSLRIRAALTVEQGMDRLGPNLWQGRSGPTVICSWGDYEEYHAYRKEVAKTSGRIFQIAGRQP